jgi:hypothetical protein
MNEIDIYNSIRSEIVVNHVLMHLTTIVVVIALLVGVWLGEKRESIVNVFLPLLSLSWAAAMVRFDFFIHRQAAYLRALEASLHERGGAVPLWETWKVSLQSTRVVIPVADVFAILIVVVITTYLLFGPARKVFTSRGWPAHRLYSWLILLSTIGLLLFLPFIPKLAAR